MLSQNSQEACFIILKLKKSPDVKKTRKCKLERKHNGFNKLQSTSILVILHFIRKRLVPFCPVESFYPGLGVYLTAFGNITWELGKGNYDFQEDYHPVITK